MKILQELSQLQEAKFETTGFVNFNDDSIDVEVVDSRGEKYGHFTVSFLPNGNTDVVANPGNPTAAEKKQLIAIAAKEVDEEDLAKLNESRLDEGINRVGDILEKFLDHKKFYNFEGSRGVRNLTEVAKALDSNYRSLEDFLEDNSGAIEAIMMWISKIRSPEWIESLKSQTPGSEDEDD